jgi:hypothetical protein
MAETRCWVTPMVSATSAWVRPGSLAYLGEVFGADRQDPLLMRFLQGGAVVGVDELVQELVAGVGEELRLLAHRCPSRYASYSASAAGMASAYHSFQRQLATVQCL